MSLLYKTIPSKIEKENEKSLKTDTDSSRSSSAQIVHNFLELRVDDKKLKEELCEKLHLKTILLNPPHKTPRQSYSHTFPRKLSSREKKKLKLQTIPPEQQQYENFLPLHHLWLGYMEELLQIKGQKKGVNQTQLNQKVMKADYHGSILRVWRSKCPSYVGTEGILLQETQNTLQLISKDNKLRTIPKAHSVFTFDLYGFRFSLYGDHMKFRASERSVRKFKEKPTIDL